MPDRRKMLRVFGSPPRVLYKYLPLQYAQQLLRKGIFRVSTAAKYRSIEGAGRGRHDAGEATRAVKFEVPSEAEFTGANPLPSPFDKLINPGPEGHMILRHSVLTMNYDEGNTFIWCTSARFSPDLLEKFGASACVSIHEPVEFFQLASEHFPRKYVDCALAACVYRDRTEDVSQNSNLHPAMLKHPDYASEQEWRALWITDPKSQPVETDLTIHYWPLTRFCRLHHALPNAVGSTCIG